MKPYMTLRESAEFLGISYQRALETWAAWTKYGVNPSRYLDNPRGHLIFKRVELERMVEQWTVI